MSKKINCYPEFDHLAYKYVIPFIERWKGKVKRNKKKDEKIYVFDKFIVEYIIYSSLVNVIKPREYKHNNDRAYCTEVMAQYIIDKNGEIDSFVNSLSNPVTDLIKIIALRHFSVVSSRDKDPELSINWESGDLYLQLKALLETLYNLRCNLFHGAKEFSDDQIALLKPASSCLSLVNKEIEKIYLKEQN